jgi:dTDP-4-amino-4,6-dideoxygalactose transaminase
MARNNKPKILSSDPSRQYASDRHLVEPAVQRVLNSGWYVLGQECQTFEEDFASFLGASGCVGAGSGTDALELALRASGIGLGDEVILPALTSSASATAIVRAGAVPVIADIDAETMNLSVASAASLVTSRTRVIMPVHMYGHPCDMDDLVTLAEQASVDIVEDCAQAHGAMWNGQYAGTFGTASAFSFYPTKNLAALGDAGAVTFTNNALLDRLRSLRQYGWRDRQVSAEIGLNSRLDEVQAAVLSERLKLLGDRNERRRQIAGQYTEALSDCDLILPRERLRAYTVYHQYVIRLEDREGLLACLADSGISAGVLYPVPLHHQPAFADCPRAEVTCAEAATRQLLCLPIFPELSDDEVELVATTVKQYTRSR